MLSKEAKGTALAGVVMPAAEVYTKPVCVGHKQ